MKPETVNAACAFSFVACIVVAVIFAILGVEIIEAYIGAVGTGIMAIFISATQD